MTVEGESISGINVKTVTNSLQERQHNIIYRNGLILNFILMFWRATFIFSNYFVVFFDRH